MTETTRTTGVSRRTLLKGAAALRRPRRRLRRHHRLPGRAVAAEPKVLRYLGTAVNQSTTSPSRPEGHRHQDRIHHGRPPTTSPSASITQPNSFDMLDTEYFSLKKLVPSGNLLGMDAKKIKEFDKITPVFTKGELPGGKKIGDQGTAPKKVLYLEGENSKKFATTPTEWITLIPTVYNADTLGIRPDLIKRPIESWAELLNPEFKGKASILNIPSIGIMDAAMVVEATGKYKYADKGNMTKEEIDLTMKVLTEAKKAGQFRAFWKDFNESVNLMASGETVIQSMWSPAVTGCARRASPARSSRSRKATAPGRRASACPRRVDGQEARRAPTSSSTGSCPAGPAPISTARATTRPCSPPPRRNMEPYEWAYWMEGKPAEKDIKAPDGALLEKAGADARRRLLRGPHGRRRLLERRDGRERLHGPQVERVHRGVMLTRARGHPATGRALGLDPGSRHGARREGGARCRPRVISWLQAGPMALVFLALLRRAARLRRHRRQLLGLQRIRDAVPAFTLPQLYRRRSRAASRSCPSSARRSRPICRR